MRTVKKLTKEITYTYQLDAVATSILNDRKSMRGSLLLSLVTNNERFLKALNED